MYIVEVISGDVLLGKGMLCMLLQCDKTLLNDEVLEKIKNEMKNLIIKDSDLLIPYNMDVYIFRRKIEVEDCDIENKYIYNLSLLSSLYFHITHTRSFLSLLYTYHILYIVWLCM